jgi:hypothetical protein
MLQGRITLLFVGERFKVEFARFCQTKFDTTHGENMATDGLTFNEEVLQNLSPEELVNYLVTVDAIEQLDLLLDWFLFTFSPEQQWDVVQQNADVLKDKRLLELVTGRVVEAYQPEIFLETVNVLASLRTSTARFPRYRT